MRTTKIFSFLSLVAAVSVCWLTTCADDHGPFGGAGRAPRATAKNIADASDLVGGPMSMGRVGDWLLANDKIRVGIQKVGRDPIGFVSPYGGNIIDADLVRPSGEPDNDQFMAMSPQINIESTFHATSIEIVNDGSDGNAAIVRASGVDDGLDYINASQLLKSIGGGLPLSVPASADDVDIPVEIVNEYSLAPGESFVRIQTSIKNVGRRMQRVYIGDYIVDSGGQTDLFVPGLGFGEPLLRPKIDFVGLRGEGTAHGVAYGYVPEIREGSTAFTQTGVTATSLGMNLIGILLLGLPADVKIPPGEVFSYVRWFVVAKDLAGVVDARNEILGEQTGRLEGTVTAGGKSLEGATVAVVKTPGRLGAPYDVISAFETDQRGTFQGTLPAGDYALLAAKDGSPYDSGKPAPNVAPVTIVAGEVARATLTLPEAGRIRVRSSDETGSPVPSKVTIVGFDPSPPLENSASLAGLLDLKAYVFDDPMGEDLFGLVQVLFLGPGGDSGEVPLEPGSYEVYVSHGPEYSRYESPIGITAGSLSTVDAKIAHVVDTSGFVSGDFHVHMINSPDSAVPKELRVRTFLAEGVDYLVASDHEFLTDLKPTIRELGAEDWIASSTGQEITPQDYGHYHGFPLTIDPGPRSMGAIDWAREAPVGRDYRTDGAYCMSPAEIFEAVRRDPGEEVVQVNHFNSGGGAGLNLLGIDTGVVPPRSTADPAPFRLDPSITNLFSPTFDALEMLIGNNNEQVDIFFDQNLGDWFNLLNQGLVFHGTSDSDTHSLNYAQAGSFRNFIASTAASPGKIDENELVQNVKEGRLVGGYAPFLTATIRAESTGENGGLTLGLPTLVRTSDGRATFHLEMSSPIWIDFDTVEIFVNASSTPVDNDEDPATPPQYRAIPTATLRAGSDFRISEIDDRPDIAGARHREAKIDYLLEGLVHDVWIVAVVHGTQGVSRPLFPVIPNDLAEESNRRLADLTDGNLGEGGVLSLSFTNPLFVDVDGNGRFDAPLARGN